MNNIDELYSQMNNIDDLADMVDLSEYIDIFDTSENEFQSR